MLTGHRLLKKFLGKVARKIFDKHYPDSSEQDVKFGIVAQVLRLLGWPVDRSWEHSAEVSFEYRDLDVLLRVGRKARLVIETKRMSNWMETSKLAIEKAKARQVGSPYLLRTDGLHWHLYDLRRARGKLVWDKNLDLLRDPDDQMRDELSDDEYPEYERFLRSDVLPMRVAELVDDLARFARRRFAKRRTA